MTLSADNYLTADEYNALTTEANYLGQLGAWALYMAPTDADITPDPWMDACVWAIDGYWATQVGYVSDTFGSKFCMTPGLSREDAEDILDNPNAYTLLMHLNKTINWNQRGGVDTHWAIRIPKSARWGKNA